MHKPVTVVYCYYQVLGTVHNRTCHTLNDGQRGRFVYTSISTTHVSNALLYDFTLLQLRHHWAMGMFQLHYDLMGPPVTCMRSTHH